ncbi:undecaprenyl-phosphate glucose phosphotransferase [uncultured Muribaculum sp.]|uniref:undecaprenyl-phosphate glucose phosphotransferase n=1 Tax=uncultured Muribaculum sp. TaxID=1918613 RepID=UPI0025FB8A2E|nr:undecaprenyl-phosphate glucose phosphotransferase [uncultured Muribaculum sp.]
MNRKGKYGKYLSYIEAGAGFLIVNLAFAVACLFDTDIVGFRWKVTWLVVNVSYLPVVMMFSRIPMPRSIHVDCVVIRSVEGVGLHALFFFALLTFLDSWVHNDSFYLWFYGLMLALLPCGLVATRMLVKRFRRKGRNYSNTVIVGTGETAHRLRAEMLADAGYGYKCLGFFAVSRDMIPPGEPMCLGTIDDLEEFIVKNDVNEIYYAEPGERYAPMKRVMRIAEDHVVRFFYVPLLNAYVSRAAQLSNIGQVSVLDIHPDPLSGWMARTVKRTFDIVFSSVALLCSPVVFIPVAIAIKLSSPGPVFFRQKRTGYKGQEFMCWKFRTMRVNSKSDDLQATRGDSRITRVGEFLRHTSIDELPQFINVWLGDMSVVGPRPHMIKHTDDYRKIIDKYMVRHFIKPGITGWAQIRGFRGQTEELWQMEKRVECDIWYMENWNFFLDIKIIVLTIVNAIRGEENAF